MQRIGRFSHVHRSITDRHEICRQQSSSCLFIFFILLVGLGLMRVHPRCCILLTSIRTIAPRCSCVVVWSGPNCLALSHMGVFLLPLFPVQLIENSVCLLRNLSYQVHREVPNCERYQEAQPVNQGPVPTQKTGCFSSRKGKGVCVCLCVCVHACVLGCNRMSVCVCECVEYHNWPLHS